MSGGLLDLSRVDANRFIGEPAEYPWGHLYGGHLVAQAATAACGSAGKSQSLAYISMVFLRAARTTEELTYDVTCLQDGRSFAFRYVTAHQRDVLVGTMLASLQEDQPGEGFQPLVMPRVPAPEDLAGQTQSWTPLFDRRQVPVPGADQASAWLRADFDAAFGSAPPSCTLAYLSDDLPARAAVAVTGQRREEPVVGHHWQPEGVRSLSLDHTIWFHDVFDPRDWHLFTFTADVLRRSRATARGEVFSRDGTLVASVAQSVLVLSEAVGS